MKTEQPALITTVLVDYDVSKYTFVNSEGISPSLQSQGIIGVCNEDTPANDYAPVIVSGIALVKTNGAISVGASITTHSDGTAKGAIDGDQIVGLALDSSSGAGEYIRVLLHASSVMVSV